MKKTENITLFLGTILIFIMILGISSCGRLTPFFNAAYTDMKSSTFTGLSAGGITTKAGTYESGFFKIDPSKITGKVVSVFFPVNNTEDEGVVVYGFYRPDIAPDNATLLDFDLSKTTRLSGVVSKKPGYKGGKSSLIMMLYSYFDVTFTHNSTTEVFRYCYGTTDPYQRGDVLRKDLATGTFKWLDLDTNQWVSSRPTNPHTISFIRNFTDPSHSDMKYFPLAGKVTSPSAGVDLVDSIVSNNDLTFTVDFDYQKAFLFDNITSQSSFDATSIETIFTLADMSQNRTRWDRVASSSESSAIITCTVTVETTPKRGP